MIEIYNDLNEAQREELDKWYEENPYCTHTAWIGTLEKIHDSTSAEKDEADFASLENKVFCCTKRFRTTFYLMRDLLESGTIKYYIAEVYSFEIVNGAIMSYKKEYMNIDFSKLKAFMNMKESSKAELQGFIKQYVKPLIENLNE